MGGNIFLNFNGFTVENGEWASNIILYFIMGNWLPMLGLELTFATKWAP